MRLKYDLKIGYDYNIYFKWVFVIYFYFPKNVLDKQPERYSWLICKIKHIQLSCKLSQFTPLNFKEKLLIESVHMYTEAAKCYLIIISDTNFKLNTRIFPLLKMLYYTSSSFPVTSLLTVKDGRIKDAMEKIWLLLLLVLRPPKTLR